MKLKLLSLLFMLAFISCSKSGGDEDPQPPSLTTASVSGIANTTAVSGGTVSSQGSSAVTARGVCWSTTENPTTSGSKTTDGSGTGSFTSNITGLTANTTYYLRAYATNSAGTAYGNQVDFTTTNIPTPGTTREFIVDIIHDYEGNTSVINSSGSTSCMRVVGALFDMDSYAVKYTVHFYDMMRTPPQGNTPAPHANATYNFNADAGNEILNGTQGTLTYTNWYNVGTPGSVTRFTPEKKLFVEISWCAGNGICGEEVNHCTVITGKARVTVHY